MYWSDRNRPLPEAFVKRFWFALLFLGVLLWHTPFDPSYYNSFTLKVNPGLVVSLLGLSVSFFFDWFGYSLFFTPLWLFFFRTQPTKLPFAAFFLYFNVLALSSISLGDKFITIQAFGALGYSLERLFLLLPFKPVFIIWLVLNSLFLARLVRFDTSALGYGWQGLQRIGAGLWTLPRFSRKFYNRLHSYSWLDLVLKKTHKFYQRATALFPKTGRVGKSLGKTYKQPKGTSSDGQESANKGEAKTGSATAKPRTSIKISTKVAKDEDFQSLLHQIGD